MRFWHATSRDTRWTRLAGGTSSNEEFNDLGSCEIEIVMKPDEIEMGEKIRELLFRPELGEPHRILEICITEAFRGMITCRSIG